MENNQAAVISDWENEALWEDLYSDVHNINWTKLSGKDYVISITNNISTSIADAKDVKFFEESYSIKEAGEIKTIECLALESSEFTMNFAKDRISDMHRDIYNNAIHITLTDGTAIEIEDAESEFEQ